MTEKFTIKQIKEALEKRQGVYKELGGALAEEAKLARAESNSARSILEGKIAGFVAQQLPSLEAPALGQLNQIAIEHNHPQRPMGLRDALLQKTAIAKGEQAELEARHGTAEAVGTHKRELNDAIERNATTRSDLRDSVEASSRTLRMLDRLNISLESMEATRITPETLAQYDRPQGLLAKVWRYITDSAYREARPVLDGYAKDGIDLTKEMEDRTAFKATLNAAELLQQSLSAKHTLAEQAERAIAKAKGEQKTDREILNEVRIATTNMILSDPAIFSAVDKAFPNALDAETKAMHTRMQLFGQLATNIGQQKSEMEDVASNLDKPVKDLKKAVSNGNGSKKVAFDLDGKTAKLDKHQLIMTQRIAAARDIRHTSHSYAATSSSSSSSNDSTNWLLWYLILSDNNHANATPANAFNSGMGGDFGGGGASGDWSKSDNSFFKAELLGVTPENAAHFGIDAKSLNIPADVARELGSSTSTGDFSNLGSSDDNRGAGLAGAALGGAAFTEFNDLSKGMDLGTQSLDMSSISRDISSLSSELSSSASSSDWGSSSSSYSSSSYSSSDSGSSYSSSSYDSGSSSSSSSFD